MLRPRAQPAVKPWKQNIEMYDGDQVNENSTHLSCSNSGISSNAEQQDDYSLTIATRCSDVVIWIHYDRRTFDGGGEWIGDTERSLKILQD